MPSSRLRSAPPRRAAAEPLRKHPLAACLGLALAMHAVAGGAGTPAPSGSLVVQTCADSGSGSLRDTLAGAPAGATIDLTALTCDEIDLAGVIAIGAGSFTLTGPGATRLAISGGDADRVFTHAGGGTLSLAGLTLTHGRGADNGGCVDAGGDLALADVTVAACAAGGNAVAAPSGGGIRVAGNATITASTFDGNTLDGTGRVRGGALAVGGTLTVADGRFTNNRATSHDTGSNSFDNITEGGAVFALGDTGLTDSTISGNTASSESYEVFGGGIAVGSHPDDAQAPLDILGGSIDHNTVDSNCGVCAPQGGGIAVVGITRLRHVAVDANQVGSLGHYGGGGGLRVWDGASVEIDASTITNNHADSAGGGMIAAESGYLTLDGSTVSGNDAGNEGGTNEGGGGVLCFSCALQLSSSTISGNTAGANGGGIAILYGDYAPAPAAVIDSTISGNAAREGGGFMLDGGDATISNSTIAFNTATQRGAGLSASEYSYSIELQSTIVSNNATGDAANNVWAFPDTVSGANNLVPNADGLPAQMPADTLTGDPLLLPLADNGGATQTHALGAGSPAIDKGNDSAGLVFDQRGDGFPREVGVADIGAFEQQEATDTDTIFKNGFETN